MHIHLLTCQELNGLSTDDCIWLEYLQKVGHKVTVGIWGCDFSYSQSTVVVIRSCWDYVEDVSRFCNWLDSLDCKVWNTPSLVRWNCDKIYLQQLQKLGVEIVPTAFDGKPLWSDIVVKPRVSNAGKNLQRLRQCTTETFDDSVLIQPFMPEIVKGEVSAIFTGNYLSHCVRKIPKAGEFRVQHLHGGSYHLERLTDDLVKVAVNCYEKLPQSPLYARLDFISDRGKWLLSECELIEPWLHFDLRPEATEFLTTTLERWSR